jgi:hypothetical protein
MKTTIVNNFLSNDEIKVIERLFRENDDLIIHKEKEGIRLGNNNLHPNTTHRMKSTYWYPGPSIYGEIRGILDPKIKNIFGNDIECPDWHILNSYRPYPIHSDSLDDENIENTSVPAGTDYAWTLLIPLNNYDSNTIVFNEESYNTKNTRTWIERNNKLPQYAIDDDTYNKYFTHDQKDIVDHFSIDTIFPWEKGNLLAMSRHRFHCSDDFYAHGLVEKRALVCWTHRTIK